jgi:hypothetical protein
LPTNFAAVHNNMDRHNDILKALHRVVGVISPSCKEAVRLQSIGLDRALTPVENLGLRIHLLFCKWCRTYGAQIRFLSAAAKKRGSKDDQRPTHPVLSREARERIKQVLKSGKG